VKSSSRLVHAQFLFEKVQGASQLTTACVEVCKALSQVIEWVEAVKLSLDGVNIIERIWKPLGQQFIGALLVI
jgi:hypothetical protein